MDLSRNNRFFESLAARHRRVLVFLAIAFCIVMAMTGAFLLRFDFAIPAAEVQRLKLALAIVIPLKLLVLYVLRIDRGWWSAVHSGDILRIAGANVLASALIAALVAYFAGTAFPRSIYLIDLVLCLAGIGAIRLLLRAYKEASFERNGVHLRKNAVLIYGSGDSGAKLLSEIRLNPKLGRRVVGFLDDDPAKKKDTVYGVTILGGGKDLPEIAGRFQRQGTRIDEILIAMPSATGHQMRQAVAYCRASEIACKTLPSIDEILTSKGLESQIRDIVVEDLLGREPVELNEAGIREGIYDHVVMVTGAGGSIGSELSRQIAGFQPRKLILLDRSESDLFRIDLDLRSKFPNLDITAAICDLIDAHRTEDVIVMHGVESVFHAAAYKHVPLMEAHPIEAARNNIVGTWNLARASCHYNVKRFVMISSDKAVNPTNIMGATKRLTELIASSFPNTSPGGAYTRFSSVRFGNVLASNGSVVPIFQKQIAEGGPVTVTHPEVRRYFMTVREAVQLVLQASTMGNGSEVFVLDMGEPVKIVDLARNMIRLAGRVPDQDIEIKFTGLRPGEKLFEELITSDEYTGPTHHQKIRIFRGQRTDMATIQSWIGELQRILTARDEERLIRHLVELVPEYQVGGQWRHALASHPDYIRQSLALFPRRVAG